jgi:hypothetical protein
MEKRMRNANKLVGECVEALAQGVALLESIDERLYTKARALPAQSGIGGHFRHCLDFYQSFLSGIHARRIDYNRRERDTLVESDRAFAATSLRIVISELLSMPHADGETDVLVSLEGETDETQNTTAWCRSTVMRELEFLLSHTIHHYALIALMLRLQGFEPGEEFGVAPSTLKHWRREEAVCAR